MTEKAAERALRESPTGWTKENKEHAPKLAEWVEEQFKKGRIKDEILFAALFEFENIYLMSSDVAENVILYTLDECGK